MYRSATGTGRRGTVIKPFQRTRWKVALALVALIGVGAWSNGSIDSRAIAALLKDPLSIFAGRSPGEREPGALTQSKPDRGPGMQVPHIVPKERVLSTVRSRPAAPLATATDSLPGAIGDAGEPIDEGTLITSEIDDPAITGGGGEPFFVPPTANGPGLYPIDNPGTGGGAVDPPTSPVPEPETWLMMIVGLCTIGGALRRARSGRKVVSTGARNGLATEAADSTAR